MVNEVEVPDVLTPVTPRVMFHALCTAAESYHAAHAKDPLALPPHEGLLVLLAQWGLETGVGRSMHCWNVGNAKHVAGDGRNYTYFACDEVIGGKVVWFYPKEAGCCFRAYASLDEGVADYYAMIRTRFAIAWPAVMSGSPGRFALLLKQAHYYTADESRYAATLSALYREFEGAIDVAPVIDDLHTVRGEQEALNLLGYGPLEVDGVFGRFTSAAVRRFQIAHAIVPSGTMTRETLLAIVDALRTTGVIPPYDDEEPPEKH